MAREIRSKGAKIEASLAPSLKKKFRRLCKKEKISMSERIRELIQRDLKD